MPFQKLIVLVAYRGQHCRNFSFHMRQLIRRCSVVCFQVLALIIEKEFPNDIRIVKVTKTYVFPFAFRA